MGPKILWVLLPLAVYAALLALLWRGKAPSRLALNVHSSLLLMAYLLTTAGLGLFWVANQQLPVFDWHYLFGYTTLLLVSLHLCLNLPTALRWLRQRRTSAPATGASADTRTGMTDAAAANAAAVGAAADGAASPRAGVGLARRGQAARLAGAAAALALAFALGSHWGGRALAPALPAPAAGPAGDIATVLRYHAASSSSRGAVFGRAPAVDWGGQPAPFKRYPSAPQIDLPRAVAGGDALRSLGAMLAGPAAPAAPAAAATLDVAAVGRLLHLTAGVTARRGGLELRAAPSSGALFPAELYLRVSRVDGLAPGLYHFDAERHRLARLRGLPAAVAPGGPDLELVVAAVFQRTGYKYRNRAYRYVAADLGHLLENARLAGHYVGAHSSLPEEFNEMALAQEFGLDGMQEGVLALVAYSRAPHRPAAVASMPPASGGSAGLAGASGGGIGVTGEVHAATSRGVAHPANANGRAGGRAGEPAGGADGGALDATGGGAGLIALPPGQPAAMDLARAILQRRSQRRFTPQPVPLRHLASLLAGMAQPALLSGALHADLVVNRVTGLQPGVYRYLPARHALQAIQLGDFATQTRNAALDQDVIGDAAVVLLLSADSSQALRSSARGYRMAFLEAGMMSERWLLGAVARGLGACPVGAFYDNEAAALIEAPPGRWVLHFAALGRTAAN